jgi:hypothetical protein
MDHEDGEYLVAPLTPDGVEVFIYPNDAGIFGGDTKVWLEEWDFLTPSELIQALVQECASRAISANAPSTHIPGVR